MLVNLLVHRANTRHGQFTESVPEAVATSLCNDTNPPAFGVTSESCDGGAFDQSDATDSSLLVNVGSFSESRLLDDSSGESSFQNQNTSEQSFLSAGYASPAPGNRDANTPEAYLSAEEYQDTEKQ